MLKTVNGYYNERIFQKNRFVIDFNVSTDVVKMGLNDLFEIVKR